MTSKNTKRLNRSLVRKAPLSPISRNWKSGWKLTPTRSQRRAENTSTASAIVAVSTSISAERRSATSAMPKGAAQLAAR